jgi:N-glycosylase/DNA lyase
MPHARLPVGGWHAISAAPCELRLKATLENGQCFGWHRQPSAEPTWVGVLGQRLLALRETETDCLYRCLATTEALEEESPAEREADAIGDELREYFQLSTPLTPLYEKWSAADGRMTTVAQALPGMRVLRQDPNECLFSFICSSNNNIARIGGMLHSLRKAYGSPMPSAACSDDPAGGGGDGAAPVALDFEPVGHGGATDFYTFPSVEALAAADEADLRSLGMGYRAAFMRQTASIILDKGSEWLPKLRDVNDPEAVRAMLCELSGVGPKVADCVALFSLDQTSAIPVDTHVWDIAVRDLDPTLVACGSLTPTVYNRVGELFRGRYGAHAGWAHSLLFAAELPLFRDLLPESTLEEMDTFRAASKAARAQEKLDRAEAKAEGRAYKRPASMTPDALSEATPSAKSTRKGTPRTTPPNSSKKKRPSKAKASSVEEEDEEVGGTPGAGEGAEGPMRVD